jgi:hypothetical protein
MLMSKSNKPSTQKKQKRLNIKSALHDGELLSSVTFEGLKVSLQ